MKKKLLISLLFISTCSMYSIMLPFKFCIFNQTFDDWRVVDISNTDNWDWPGATRPEQLCEALIKGHTSQCWDFVPNFWATSAPFNARLLSDHDEWVAFRVETYNEPCHSPSDLIFKLKEPTMLPLLCGSTLKLVEAPPKTTTTTTTTSTTTIAPSPATDASFLHFWLLIPVFLLIFLATGVFFWVKHRKIGAAVERVQFGSREELLPSMFVPSDPVERLGADLQEKFIGRGSFGEVYELINYSRPAVIKYVRCFTANEVALYQKEFEVLEKLSHSNVVALLGTMKKPEKFGIIMEFCEQGELKRLLHDARIVYTMRTVVTWSEQLFEAVRYMYREFNLIHRDINPTNIFVTSRFHLKMGDFGLSKCIEQSCSGTFVGTPRYMSPPQRIYGDQENNTDELQNSHRNDIFSLGLVLWEMIERRIVFADYGKEHFHRDDFVADLLKEKPDMLSLPKCPSHFQKIIKSCTNFNRRFRPMAAEVLYQINKPIPFSNEFHFEPIIDEEQKRILRPIGFDESVERVPIEEEAESDLELTLSFIHRAFASGTQSIS